MNDQTDTVFLFTGGTKNERRMYKEIINTLYKEYYDRLNELAEKSPKYVINNCADEILYKRSFIKQISELFLVGPDDLQELIYNSVKNFDFHILNEIYIHWIEGNMDKEEKVLQMMKNSNTKKSDNLFKKKQNRKV